MPQVQRGSACRPPGPEPKLAPSSLCAPRQIVLALLLGAASATWAQPQADHLKCYKIKDPLKLAGTADVNTPQLGIDPGCTISRAKLFCVPATKSGVAVVDKTTGSQIVPLPITGPDPGDRICYKIKCKAIPLPDAAVTDQFGSRIVGKLKAAMLCAPAVKGSGPVAISLATFPTVTCTTEGEPCEPCHQAGLGLDRPGPGYCARGVEGDLRCQVFGCAQPASNCTSSSQCAADEFCGVDGGGPGVNACCSLCRSVLVAPVPLSNPGIVVAGCTGAGDPCGTVFDPYNPDFAELWCPMGFGDFERGFCAASVESDIRCQVGGCLQPASNCTSSAECDPGFFCGRDGDGPGMNACCRLCQQG